MAKFERVDITVEIEGDAQTGERCFARLFDKYNALYRGRLEQQSEQSNAMSAARSISPRGQR